jgi:hypothetical protein
MSNGHSRNGDDLPDSTHRLPPGEPPARRVPRRGGPSGPPPSAESFRPAGPPPSAESFHPGRPMRPGRDEDEINTIRPPEPAPPSSGADHGYGQPSQPYDWGDRPDAAADAARRGSPSPADQYGSADQYGRYGRPTQPSEPFGKPSDPYGRPAEPASGAAPPPGAPAPTREAEPPRRRKRWRKVLGIGLIVLLLLLVVGDRVGVRIATNEMKKRIELAVAENSEPTAPKPTVSDVSLSGFPFLTQVLLGNYKDIRFTIQGITTPGPRIQQIKARLKGVHVPLGDAIRDDVGQVPVDEIQGTVAVTYEDLNVFLAKETADDTFRNVMVTPVGNGERVEATAQVDVPVLGAQTVKGVAAFKVVNGALSLAVEQIGIQGTFNISVPLPAFNALSLFDAPKLPFNLQLVDARTDANGLSVTAKATDVTLPAA